MNLSNDSRNPTRTSMHILHPNVLSYGEFMLSTALVMMSFLKMLTLPRMTGNIWFKEIQACVEIVA